MGDPTEPQKIDPTQVKKSRPRPITAVYPDFFNLTLSIEMEYIGSARVIKSILGLCRGLPTADPPEQHEFSCW